MPTRTLTLQPLASGSKNSLQAGTQPGRYLGASFFTMTWLALSIGVVVSLLVLLIMAAYGGTNYFPQIVPEWLKPKRPEENSQASQQPSTAVDEEGSQIQINELETLLERAI